MSIVVEVINKNAKHIKHTISLSRSPVSIGRSSKCDLVLPDEKISGKHVALLIGANGKAQVTDLGSTNGTWLNGNKVGESHFYLEDSIEFGDVHIQLIEAAMDEKEKELHTREGGKTSFTFVQLEGSSSGKKQSGEGSSKTILGRLRKEKKEKDGETKLTKPHILKK
jgi:pSer/pThr/pTyr-binding forkhead associated (FHA) protein